MITFFIFYSFFVDFPCSRKQFMYTLFLLFIIYVFLFIPKGLLVFKSLFLFIIFPSFLRWNHWYLGFFLIMSFFWLLGIVSLCSVYIDFSLLQISFFALFRYIYAFCVWCCFYCSWLLPIVWQINFYLYLSYPVALFVFTFFPFLFLVFFPPS